MQRMIMNLAGAKFDFIVATREIMKTREYQLVNLGSTPEMVNVTQEELDSYILLLYMSKDYET